METTDRAKGQMIRLNYTGGEVVVTPEDEDRFVLTAQNAVKACQDHHRQSEAIKSFKNQFLRPLVEWCSKHANKVQACYIPFPVGYIQVFIVGTSPQYDLELGKEISTFELGLAEAGWRVNVLQLPNAREEDLQTYFNMEGALQVYAQFEAASRQGDS